MSIETPMLSVVVVVRNQPGYIQRLLTMLRPKELVHAEVIISDDASDDGGETIGTALGVIRQRGLEGSVRVLANETWGHAGGARNKGFEDAIGRWVWNFDSDDMILPGAIPRIVEACGSVREECDCIYLPHREIQSSGFVQDHLAEMRCVPEVWRCAPWAKVVRFDKAAMVPFREGHHFEDCDWWYGMADVIDHVECLPGDPVMIYDRTTGGSMDGLGILQDNRLNEHYLLYELLELGKVGANTIADYLALLSALVKLHRSVKRDRVRCAIGRLLEIMGNFCP